MTHRRRLLWLLVPILAVGMTACDGADSSTMLGPGSSDLSRAPEGWSSLIREEVKAIHRLERERIKREKELRRAEERALRAEFDAFKRSGLLPKSRIGVDLLICQPQAYDAETAIIGPSGGEIRAGDHKLIIPEGALQDWTVITMEVPPSLLVEVKFTPHGVHFDRQPLLKLSYKDCWVPHNHPFSIVYLDDIGTILERPLSVDLKHFGEVYGWIDHFSRYAVASNVRRSSADSL
jgi:hypothetical protein